MIVLVVLLSVVMAPFALARATSATERGARGGASPVVPVAAAISTVTGIAISPLLGTGLYGAYQWIRAENEAARAALPWYSQASFWLPALLIVVICAAKDSFGAAIPTGLKKPLDVLETIENKFSALIAAGAVIPFTLDTLTKILLDHSAAVGGTIQVGGLAMFSIAAADFSWLVTALTLPFALAVFAVVWMASHAINVLILLSPWGAIDAALKASRTALLGAVAITPVIDPWLGIGLSVLVILVAYLVAGWAFRLTTFGTVFCWDFLTVRRARFAPQENSNLLFSGPNLTAVPVRTYGRLNRREDGTLEFTYRRFLVLPPRSIPVDVAKSEIGVGRGVFYSDVLTEDERNLFILPPRYRGHEETVAIAYGFGSGIRDVGLRKAWGELREMVGGRAVKEPSGTPALA